MTAPASPAPIVHVALTVTNLERSIAWYAELFGMAPAYTGAMLEGTPHHYTVAVWATPNVGLHCFSEQADGAFTERRAGLDHVAFDCPSIEELEAWAAHLDDLDIERGEILREPYGAGLAFRDPDNIALEFFVAARNLPSD